MPWPLRVLYETFLPLEIDPEDGAHEVGADEGGQEEQEDLQRVLDQLTRRVHVRQHRPAHVALIRGYVVSEAKHKPL